LARWKATEFRQFLLYSGIVVLHSIIPNQVYDHCLCLHVAMVIYLSPNYNNLSTFANSLLTDFVNNFGYCMELILFFIIYMDSYIYMMIIKSLGVLIK